MVRVVGINPGPIATERADPRIRKEAPKDGLGNQRRWQELMKPLPMGRAGTA